MNIRRNSSTTVIASLLLVVVLLISACAAAPAAPAPAGETVSPTEAPATSNESPAEATEPAETTEESAASGESVVITHAQGETTVVTNPQTVVVFDYSVLDTLDQLGIPVAGVPQGTNIPPFLEKYKGTEYANVGTLFEPDYEKVNELQPDLIIVAGRSSTVYPDLAKIAPTIDLTVDSANLVPSMISNFNTLGTIFGKEEEVASHVAELEASIARVNDLAATSGQTALIVMVSGGEVTAFGPGSRFGIIHDVLGVTPIAEDVETETHGDAISFEYILEKDPDILFVVDRDVATGESSESAAAVLDNELVHSTKAWQNDKLVYLDPAAWYLANAGLSTLATMVSEVEVGLGGTGEASTPAESTGEGIVVNHVQGETTLPAIPERVVVFDFSVLDTLDELGIPVVGVPSSTNVPPFLSQYAGAEYANVGTLFEPDYEKVNELQPDLILVALRSGPLYPDLAKIAPTVDLTVDGTNLIPTFKESITNIGIIFGKEAEVESRLAEIDASIARVNELATTTGQTALIVMVSGGEVTAFGPGSRFGIIHDVLGVTPISEDVETETHGDAISFEYILEKNPDILFVIDRDAATGETSESAEAVLDNELVHATSAWQNDKVFYLDPAAWYLANTGLGTMATMISEVEAALQ